MSTKRPKKIRTRKSTGRSTATSAKRRKAKKPRVTPSPTYPPPWPDDCNGLQKQGTSAFEERLVEVYQTNKGGILARLRSKGVSDPENVLHSAIETIVRRPSISKKGLRYLPKRLISRVLSAMAKQYRYQERNAIDGDEQFEGIAAQESHSGPSEFREVVEQLFERLSDRDAQVLRWFHFKNRSIATISAVTGRPNGTVKSDLHRARKRAGKILKELGFQPNQLRNLRHGSEG